jgi:phytoene dehydrogenase-like protein
LFNEISHIFNKVVRQRLDCLLFPLYQMETTQKRKQFFDFSRHITKKVPKHSGALVIGSGMAGLTTAALLSSKGINVTVLEKNWLPGGCSSSYPRKNYVFESGATTLVGLDEKMPLHHLFSKTGIKVPAIPLEIPMEVRLKSGKTLVRYPNLDSWIGEASRVFGPENQRPFWEYCFKISEAVWQTSLQQRAFPPSSLADLLSSISNFRFSQLKLIPKAFSSMQDLLQTYGLDKNAEFVDFVNEQLLITAQNHAKEVNVLFGATALCYTLYTNYYVQGGLINLIRPIVDYLETRGSQVLLREGAIRAWRENENYFVETKNGIFSAPILISAIPINNTLEVFDLAGIQKRYRNKTMGSVKLNSAFQMGIVFKRRKDPSCLHHQIHLSTPLPFTGSKSIFVSLSHPDDHERCGPEETVASVSTHVPDPEQNIIQDKEALCQIILSELEKQGILTKTDVLFYHASTPKAWQKWTSRSWGFVGGYPQYMSVKPWKMIDARLDPSGAYICGDSTYPGQGIPGACLSGIIAFEKILLDGRISK